MSRKYEVLGPMVSALVEVYKEQAEKVPEYQLDAYAEPLLAKLVELGALPDTLLAFVEWQGVAEFGLVPVCHYDARTDTEIWLNVYQDGTVEVY